MSSICTIFNVPATSHGASVHGDALSFWSWLPFHLAQRDPEGSVSLFAEWKGLKTYRAPFSSWTVSVRGISWHDAQSLAIFGCLINSTSEFPKLLLNFLLMFLGTHICNVKKTSSTKVWTCGINNYILELFLYTLKNFGVWNTFLQGGPYRQSIMLQPTLSSANNFHINGETSWTPTFEHGVSDYVAGDIILLPEKDNSCLAREKRDLGIHAKYCKALKTLKKKVTCSINIINKKLGTWPPRYLFFCFFFLPQLWIAILPCFCRADLPTVL